MNSLEIMKADKTTDLTFSVKQQSNLASVNLRDKKNRPTHKHFLEQ